MKKRHIDIYTLSLFEELRAARAPAPSVRIKSPRARAAKIAEIVQAAKAIEDEVEGPPDPILTVRQSRSGKWAGMPAEAKAGLSSVFDLASKALSLRRGSMGTAATTAGGSKYASRIQPSRGVTRIEGAAYPSRWTAEDYKREEQRRARQVPPRPGAKARTRGKVVRAMDGEAVD